MEWTKITETAEDVTYVEHHVASDSYRCCVTEVLNYEGFSTGFVRVRVTSRPEANDILSIKVPADPGEDPCATARAKAEEFIKLFDL